MDDILNELVSRIALEQLDENLFRGNSLDIGTGRVYGGQALGQALKAAQLSAGSDRPVHSLHAYFMREGDHHLPVEYCVEASRNGRSFSTRQVTASQRGRPIFIALMSFHRPESGLDYQSGLPAVPDPEEALAALTQSGYSGMPEAFKRLAAPFELRPILTTHVSLPQPARYLWFRTRHGIGDDPDLHRALLAYVSDYGLLTSTLIPHEPVSTRDRIQIASLDHAMWFHNDSRIDQWLLYACKPLYTGHGRGLAMGSLYNREGVLIATTMQEGLIRPIKKGG